MKAAIFDMDGTILDSMTVWDGFGQDYLCSIGIEPPETLWEDIRTLSIEEAADYFIARFALPQTREELIATWDVFVAERYRLMAKLKPGVKEYLKILAAQGVKMCLATATAGFIAREMLKTHDILHFFEFIITEEDVGASKTQPDIYLAAAHRLGVAVSDCVIFEDSLHAIEGAKKADFTVWGVYDESSADRQDKICELCERMIDFEEEVNRLS